MQAHGLTTKFIPLVFTVIALLYISDYTRDTFLIIEPENAFLGTVLLIGGVIFLYEGMYSLPDSKKSAIGSMGAVIFFILMAINFIFAIAIIFDKYDALNDSGDINFILQLVVLANVIILLAEGVYEVVLSRRFTFHKAIYQ